MADMVKLSKHRVEKDIIADILSIVKQKPKKTHIMYKANLSYTLLSKYLDKLELAKLIRYSEIDTVYELTERGSAYLDIYAEYERLKNQLESNKSTLYKKEANLIEMIGSDNHT
ncbi:MAG: hypothetical protein QG670_590 [Thermoproteota archaeon]|nr:hypothetical protein [Thermoproteota archaeon]